VAHNIARIAGTDQAWYADKPAWHGLGNVTPGAKTARQVVKAVPVFSERVETAPVYMKAGGKLIELADFRATYRVKSKLPLGVVSTDYTVLQDSDALVTLEAVVNAARRASFVTAGALGKGEKLFASIDLSKVTDLTIKRDPSRQESHLFGTWAHDGSGALRVGLYGNRVECQNMLNAALGYSEGRGLLVSIRHVGDLTEHLREAQHVLGFIEKQAKAHVALMNALNSVPVPTPTQKWLNSFLDQLVPIPPEMERPASREVARNEIRGLFAHSKTLVGVPQSPYRVLQAVAEYADHYRPMRVGGQVPVEQAAERRFRSIIEGPAADMKARALELLRQEFMVDAPSGAKVLIPHRRSVAALQ